MIITIYKIFQNIIMSKNLELTVVRGELKECPVVSAQLADYFESIKNELEGVLYLGFPIINTNEGGFQIQSLLITKKHGFFVINFIESETNFDFHTIQDYNYNVIKSKLSLHANLLERRNLKFEINTITYAPRAERNIVDQNYILFKDLEDLKNHVFSLSWDTELYEKTMSVIQSLTSIRKSRKRNYVQNPDSRGAILKRIEDSIANLDKQQNRAVIETVDGVQRIRGLAGSGKTIILALKVAYLHIKNPDWKIAVTFNTRSLKDQFRRLINTFIIEQSNIEPDWTKIDIIHAWGSYDSEGLYYNLCKEHSIRFYDFRDAKEHVKIYGREFEFVCQDALKQINVFKNKYDLIVVDEAQDFSPEFLKICYNILHDKKRLIYAYDELQSLTRNSMEGPEVIFGTDSKGEALVTLTNKPNHPMEDIILYKCYRNPKEILSAAHALGFGIYREEGLVQIFENASLWNEVGYEVIKGNLQDGENVVLARNNESSPDFLSEHSTQDDLISFKSFSNNDEQVEYIVNQIIKNIQEDELMYDDIVVINPDPLTTKKVVGIYRAKLLEYGINSKTAGVASSPDIFFEDNIITFTGVFRAKGNEAAMVYVINAQDSFEGYDLAKKRNALFTAMTRSKAWLRVVGYGKNMTKLVDEFDKIKNNNFNLEFSKYPTLEEREKLYIINREKTNEEKDIITKYESTFKDFVNKLDEGKVFREDLDQSTLDALKKLLDNE